MDGERERGRGRLGERWVDGEREREEAGEREECAAAHSRAKTTFT